MLVYTLLHDFEVFEGPLPDLSGVADLGELARLLWDVSDARLG
ncbi:hypothetical protein GCM10022419_088450 [Nonomuraea rosea]|uniref:Uncharacterized protein n=1 Tax=Nonomuraea rosea TaxID=638574 RepID=A0ABP6YZL7_9ACTN